VIPVIPVIWGFDMEDVFGNLAMTAAVIVGVIFLLVYAWSTRIVKVGPNEVLVVFGRKHRIINPDGSADVVGYRIVHGGRAFIWPIFEDYKILSLELFTIDIETPEVYTKQGVPIMVEGIAQIKIKSDSVSIRTAAEQFLNKPLNEVTAIAHQTLEGHLRAILGTMDVEEVNSNRDAFAQQVQEVAATDLAYMGLGVVSFTIKDIRDNQGYLEALGKRRTAEVKRDASIGEANAMRDSEIGKSAAQAEAISRSSAFFQEGQVAKIKAEISVAEAEKNKKIRLAEFDGDSNTKKAEADLAYDLQKYKTNQLVKTEEIQVEIIEKTRRIELEEREIDRRRKELMATIEAPADAESRRIRTIAQAERDRAVMQAEGQAAAVKTRGFAEAEVLKASGLADAEAEKAKGLALAEVEKARGLAEAEVCRQTGIAEAEAMEKKAQAWASYNEAAIAQMFIEKLPEIVSAAAQPLSKVDKIVLIGGGEGGSGASRLTREVVDMVAQLPPVLESVTGIKLADLIKSVPAMTASVSHEGKDPASGVDGDAAEDSGA
jgi:flotillin